MLLKCLLPLLFILLICFTIRAQDDAAYLKDHAVRITDAEKLSDSAYNLLSPFQVIMFGEMHGTNESAPFTNGLVQLFTNRGDSVQVGLEIPPATMTLFMAQHTDSSIAKSDFFVHQNSSAKESIPWLTLLIKLNNNPRVTIFFFDVDTNEGKTYQRDSLMYAKIKVQYKKHPTWRIVTLSGNYHNRIEGGNTMANYLMQDKTLNIAPKICTLNMEYLQGKCNANFGHGLEIKALGSYPSVYNSTEGYDHYLILAKPNSGYAYTGFYYTKNITAARMVGK